MPPSEKLQRLREAGLMVVTPVPAAYEQVIEEMSEEEFDVLRSFTQRLAQVSPAVDSPAVGSPWAVILGPVF